MAEKKLCMTYSQVKAIEGQIRDILNWVAAFKQEYDIPSEVERTLKRKLMSLAKKVGNAKVLK